MKPVLQALVVADHVYQDRSGKMIICGTFSQILQGKPEIKRSEANVVGGDPGKDVPVQMPVAHAQRMGTPYAYLCLTGIRGETALDLRYVDLKDNRVYFVVNFKMGQSDPVLSCEGFIPLPELPRPHPGAYSLELLHEEEILGSWRINVRDHELD